MVMRLQETSIPQEINLNNPVIELGNTSIHSAYHMQVHIEATNETGAAKTPTIAEFLGCIPNLSIVSDHVKYHYSQPAKDIALRDAMRTAKGLSSRVVDKTFTSVADDATMSADFLLSWEEGDIIALNHDSVQMRASFASNLAENCPITKIEIKPTIYELIPNSNPQQATAELVERYGQGFAGALEPKVYSFDTTYAANTEVTGGAALPTGGLLRGALMQWSVAPSQFGLIGTTPSRSELMRLNWDTARAKDERRFRTEIPTGAVWFDFDTELTRNGLGLDGRNFNRGDYLISAKTSAQTTLHYISYEMMFPAVAGGVLNTGHNMF